MGHQFPSPSGTHVARQNYRKRIKYFPNIPSIEVGMVDYGVDEIHGVLSKIEIFW
jgi:hypothetical protein